MATGFGIVGCGMIANFHARAIADVRGARLAACFDTVPAAAQRLAAARPTSRASCSRRRKSSGCSSSTRRCPADRRARRTASSPSCAAARGHVRGASRWRAYSRAFTLIGAAGAGQLAKMVNQIASPAWCRALRRRSPSPRRLAWTCAGDRGDRQGRRAELADGEPLQDHGGRQVRLRLRGRLDAQGPAASCSTRPSARAAPRAGDVAGRPVLCRRAGQGRHGRWDTSSLITRLK